jgi:hypothetical protein
MNFLPPDRQFVRPSATLGEALKVLAEKFAPINTAKVAERRWKLSAPTAENITKGIASGTTLVKAVRAEGEDAWALWDAIGELIIGESREDYDERFAALLQERADYARQRLEARRARHRELEARAATHLALPDREGVAEVPS